MEILTIIGFILIFFGAFTGTTGILRGEGAMAFIGLMGLVFGFLLVSIT